MEDRSKKEGERDRGRKEGEKEYGWETERERRKEGMRLSKKRIEMIIVKK